MNLTIEISLQQMQQDTTALNNEGIEIADSIAEVNDFSYMTEHGINYVINREAVFASLPLGIREILRPLVIERIKSKLREQFEEWIKNQ